MKELVDEHGFEYKDFKNFESSQTLKISDLERSLLSDDIFEKKEETCVSWLFEIYNLEEETIEKASGKEAVLYLIFVKFVGYLFICIFAASGIFLIKTYYDLSFEHQCSSKDSQEKYFKSITMRMSLISYQ